jgi:hypothetical protein
MVTCYRGLQPRHLGFPVSNFIPQFPTLLPSFHYLIRGIQSKTLFLSPELYYPVQNFISQSKTLFTNYNTYSSSKTPAAPIPPPTHIVMRP